MTVKVRIPTPLMKLTDNQSEVSAEGKTISDIINNLENQFNGIKIGFVKKTDHLDDL